MPENANIHIALALESVESFQIDIMAFISQATLVNNTTGMYEAVFNGLAGGATYKIWCQLGNSGDWLDTNIRTTPGGGRDTEYPAPIFYPLFPAVRGITPCDARVSLHLYHRVMFYAAEINNDHMTARKRQVSRFDTQMPSVYPLSGVKANVRHYCIPMAKS